MKLLIHIGYPKTATTTLQHKIFYELYKQNKINFLGKTLLGFNKAQDMLEHIMLNKKIDSNIKLSENKINVISEELLSSTFWYLDRNKDIIYLSLSDMAYRAYMSFKDYKSVKKIILSIRNYPDLIYSFYVENYISNFRYFDDLNTPQKFLEHLFNNTEKYTPFFEMFYFSNVLDSYAKYFGKENMEIFFYEDLVNKEKIYYEKWAKLLNMNVDVIENLFETKENVKKKGKKGYIIELDYGYLLSAFLHETGLIKIYSKVRDNFIIRSVSKNIYTILKRRIKEKIEFEKFDDVTKQKIREFFKEDILKVAEKYDLDMNKLKKYGYI